LTVTTLDAKTFRFSYLTETCDNFGYTVEPTLKEKSHSKSQTTSITIQRTQNL